MKLLLVIMSMVALSAAETYSTEHDDLDIEAVISSPNGLKSYYECFTDKSPCDAVQSFFKKDVGEAIQQACAKCSPAQKHIMNRFIAGMKEKLPDSYENLKETFDPENKYFLNLEVAVANS